MDIEYRRDMNHNYMIVKSAGADIPDDYETRVLITNRIPGLLTCRMQYIDTEIWYSYDVTSLQKLTVFSETRSIGKKEFITILSEILRILEGRLAKAGHGAHGLVGRLGLHQFLVDAQGKRPVGHFRQGRKR